MRNTNPFQSQAVSNPSNAVLTFRFGAPGAHTAAALQAQTLNTSLSATGLGRQDNTAIANAGLSFRRSI